jgi:hypothetical protein
MIAEYVEGIMRKGLQRYAKEIKSDVTNIQLLIGWDENSDSANYKILSANAPPKKITFNEFLKVPFDILSREQLVLPVVRKTLEKYSSETDCKPSEISIVVYLEPQEEDDDKVGLHLYKGSSAMKKVNLEQIMIQ